MYNPLSTYRIQFNKDYNFKDFKKNIEYLSLLGIGSLYASPIFEAAPGSMHGYDVTNPEMINPEIGKYGDFEEITDKLKSKNIGWIQDIVPNHMAFHMHNLWLMDVLEKGELSKYAHFFDIDFSHPDFGGKIMIPFLGKELLETIKDGEIVAGWHRNNFIFRYFDFWFPFSYESFTKLINENLSGAPENFSGIWKEFNSGQENEGEFRDVERTQMKEKIRKFYLKSAPFKTYIDSLFNDLNDDKALMKEILDRQHYRLCYWNESSDRLNYRRFFTVSSLICLKMENDDVFEGYHRFIGQQVLQKRFNGLRIDHIDGLSKPLVYIEKLRTLTGDDTYIVAEKILQKDEELMPDLPMQGTSGYDFLGMVNDLFTCKNNYHLFQKFYRKTTGIKDDVADVVYNKKKFILTWRMHAEWDNLTRQFAESGFIDSQKGLTRESAKEAIGEFLLCFPVYKLYSDRFPLTYEDKILLKTVFENAERKNPSLKQPLHVLRNIFLYQEGFGNDAREKALAFFLRCMQFTGPLMAKGVEDTVMYYYNCFISHNEVGDDPGSEGISIEQYHKLMINRLKSSPMAMNATSTHDTKRGEDVRARINVVSEFPEEWFKNVEKWIGQNQKFKTLVDGTDSPTLNEEYFIYQTLAGVFPFEGNVTEEFLKRMDEYLIKSLREAKTDTNWNFPNEDHESAVIDFTRKILNPEGEFLKSFIPFQKKISNYGIINSLSQLVLKAASPGIPDFYQGTELWDLSMVDPDNRRPVDYARRSGILRELMKSAKDDPECIFNNLSLNMADGRIKLWMTHQLMKERRSDPDLFTYGKYIPLQVKGKYSGHILAFARVHENRWFIVAVPLFVSMISENKSRSEPGPVDWADTRIKLPENAPGKWFPAYFGNGFSSEKNIYLSDIMKVTCPLFLKGWSKVSKRAAGILVHIPSLPGKYGSGDVGEEAYRFADWLVKNGQSYWQILPFNPAEKVYGYSPYSSQSAFAGNLSHISPDLLANAGLVQKEGLIQKIIPETSKIKYGKSFSLRKSILDEAFVSFKEQCRPYRQKSFLDFCNLEKHWLDDFALFVILKREFRNAPWTEWPREIKNRESDALKEFISSHETGIEKEKFFQYLFNVQWKKLKSYCNNNGIRIIGDMSFYVNYDSADVWANPKNFRLDEDKNPTHVGGVPPDYFSSTGQLWGMPAYNWEAIKEDGYSWWLARIRRNMEMCNLVRFDHFRGFSEYWEVPSDEKTAENGKWSPGPGHDFFDKIMEEFPGMPFIAEDLGTIDEKVYKLRDDYGLPGMAVLQFAFGDATPHSIYTPHNHTFNSIVYTGTHDNNTTRGWYINELDRKYRKEAEEYTGHRINEKSCHLDFIRMAYGSVARIAIIPIQDILGLDEHARMNKPSTTGNNWKWKMTGKDLEKKGMKRIRKMLYLSGRH